LNGCQKPDHNLWKNPISVAIRTGGFPFTYSQYYSSIEQGFEQIS